jgi:GntR family transcriptional regulator, transcriptional repressor for pyruvate dehydrogenase complex
MRLPSIQSKPLDRQRLGDIVAERMGEWINDSQLKPGDRLPSEPELSSHFGVARSVVREALAKLKTLGIIEVFQGKGAFIADMPLELLFLQVRRLNPERTNPQHLWEIRTLLEMHSAAEAAKQRSRDDLLALERIIQESHNNHAKNAPYSNENERFHRLVARASGNPILEQLISDFIGLLGQQILNRGVSSTLEHQKILDAIRAHKPEQAAQMMKQHLQNSRISESIKDGKQPYLEQKI